MLRVNQTTRRYNYATITRVQQGRIDRRCVDSRNQDERLFRAGDDSVGIDSAAFSDMSALSRSACSDRTAHSPAHPDGSLVGAVSPLFGRWWHDPLGLAAVGGCLKLRPNSMDLFAQTLAFKGVRGDAVSVDQCIESVEVCLNCVERLARKRMLARVQGNHRFEPSRSGDSLGPHVAIVRQQQLPGTRAWLAGRRWLLPDPLVSISRGPLTRGADQSHHTERWRASIERSFLASAPRSSAATPVECPRPVQVRLSADTLIDRPVPCPEEAIVSLSAPSLL
jgi:hypothetical protein